MCLYACVDIVSRYSFILTDRLVYIHMRARPKAKDRPLGMNLASCMVGHAEALDKTSRRGVVEPSCDACPEGHLHGSYNNHGNVFLSMILYTELPLNHEIEFVAVKQKTRDLIDHTCPSHRSRWVSLVDTACAFLDHRPSSSVPNTRFEALPPVIAHRHPR